MVDARTRTSIVTGGAGFIGSHLATRLLSHGDQVVVVDDLSSGKLERLPAGAEFHELDITDATAMLELVERCKPARIFHLAAQADVRVSVRDPLMDATANVLGTISLMKAVEATRTPIIFTSTGGAIYGEYGAIPTPEGSEELPLSPYGTAKLSAEKYLLMHTRLVGISHAILRLANVYGPHQDPHGEAGVVAIFGGRLLGKEEVTVYGDGSQTRDYVYVDDVVDAIVAAGEQVATATEAIGPINIGTGIETSVNELLRVMQEAAGTDVAPTFAPPRPGELGRSALDVTLARGVLDVALDTPLADGVKRTVASIAEARALSHSAH